MDFLGAFIAAAAEVTADYSVKSERTGLSLHVSYNSNYKEFGLFILDLGVILTAEQARELGEYLVKASTDI